MVSSEPAIFARSRPRNTTYISSKRRGQGHARGAAESRGAASHPRTIRGFVQKHCDGGPARKQHHVRRKRRRSERGIDDRDGRFCQAGNRSNLFRLDVIKLEHHFEGLLSFFFTFGRERDVVRVSAYSAIEMIFRQG